MVCLDPLAYVLLCPHHRFFYQDFTVALQGVRQLTGKTEKDLLPGPVAMGQGAGV